MKTDAKIISTDTASDGYIAAVFTGFRKRVIFVPSNILLSAFVVSEKPEDLRFSKTQTLYVM